MDSKLLYSKHDAARLLSVSLRTVDYLISSKQLPVRRVGSRTLIAGRDLDLFIRSDHPETGRLSG
jgi:excisionase family DNA binding protein